MVDISNPIGILAELAAAFGTIILAICTYKSIQMSKETLDALKVQVDIAKRELENKQLEIEKPRIIENIQRIINFLQGELRREINAIDIKQLIWSPQTDVNNLYSNPLIFPISERKIFFDDFGHIFNTTDPLKDPEIFNLINLIGAKIQERHEIYTKLDSLLNSFTERINESHFDKRINDLLDNTNYRLPSPTEPPQKDIISISPYFDANIIEKGEVSPIIKSMIISSLIKPLKKDDFRLNILHNLGLTTELSAKIPEFLEKDPIPESEEFKQAVENLFNNLKNLDVVLLKNIMSLKEIYGKKYTLTESQLTPYGGMS